MKRVPAPRDLPPRMPALRDAFRRALCRAVLRACGWGVRGEFPDLPRVVLIIAPHSSWWDGWWGLLMKVAVGADVRFMAKRELFHPPLGGILRTLGGVPIDRHAAGGVVEQMISRFARHDTLWLGIAPEGTRRHVARWKSGYWHIARGAGVPILPVAFDYPSRSIVVGAPLVPGGDPDADTRRLRAFYAPFKGRRHDV